MPTDFNLCALFHETKAYLQSMIKKRETINIKQEEHSVSLPQLRIFFHDSLKMFQSLMKGIKGEDIVPTFIIDNLFKIIMIKVDEIIQNNKRVIDNAVELQKYQVKQLKQDFETELESMDQTIALMKHQHRDQLSGIKERLELAFAESAKY